jgi:hypothetical protein
MLNKNKLFKIVMKRPHVPTRKLMMKQVVKKIFDLYSVKETEIRSNGTGRLHSKSFVFEDDLQYPQQTIPRKQLIISKNFLR